MIKPKYPSVKLEPNKYKFKNCNEELLDSGGYCKKHSMKIKITKLEQEIKDLKSMLQRCNG